MVDHPEDDDLFVDDEWEEVEDDDVEEQDDDWDEEDDDWDEDEDWDDDDSSFFSGVSVASRMKAGGFAAVSVVLLLC